MIVKKKPVAIRNSAIGKKKRGVKTSLRTKSHKVPKSVRVFQVCDRISLHHMHQRRKMNRISDEEHGQIIPNQIPVAFFGVKLYCETSMVSNSVW